MTSPLLSLSTLATIEQQLNAVQEAVDAIIESLNPKDFHGEAINWGDLGVVDVEFCVNKDLDEYFVISIEEADPEAGGLCSYIARQLQEKGFKCWVRSEW